MRKNFGAKPYLYPQPVFMIATYNEDNSLNLMAAAWGGVAEEDEIFMCLSAEHKTIENIRRTGAFTVSMADADHIASCDYVGLVSGNDVPEKAERAGFHGVRSEFVNAPVVEELKMSLECELISFEEDSCRLFGKVINVSADESVLNEKGKIDPAKLRPITFDPCGMGYYVLGERVGNAFKDGGVLLKKE